MRLDSVQPSAASELLALWERAVGAPPLERADALLAAHLDMPPASLGARNAALLELRAHLFGNVQRLHSRCAACGATAEFTVDCLALARDLLPSPDAEREHRLDVDGWHIQYRVPVAADVRLASEGAADRDAFARRLLQRCVTGCERDNGGTCELESIPQSAADALSRCLEALEPGATVGFDLACPECGERWNAAMDCATIVWSEVEAYADRLFLDVDALARTYGWSEAEVLALSGPRRAAYLQLIGGD